MTGKKHRFVGVVRLFIMPLVLLLMLNGVSLMAQTPHKDHVHDSLETQLQVNIGTEFVSYDIYRGFKQASASLHPMLLLSCSGFHFEAWGAVGVVDPNDIRGLDLSIEYCLGGFSVGVVDYWDDSRDTRYFSYKKDTSGHIFEGYLGYDFGPVGLTCYTMFAGQDFLEKNGKRAWSTYIELTTAEIEFAKLNWKAELGFVPWTSDEYMTDRAALVNVSLQASRYLHVGKFVIPVWIQLAANPKNRDLFMVFGTSIKL